MGVFRIALITPTVSKPPLVPIDILSTLVGNLTSPVESGDVIARSFIANCLKREHSNSKNKGYVPI